MIIGVSMKNIYDMTLQDLEYYFESKNQKKFIHLPIKTKK